jgi:4-amino-4-deoxy-L-arabinose transferase-like glycosyltransferase
VIGNEPDERSPGLKGRLARAGRYEATVAAILVVALLVRLYVVYTTRHAPALFDAGDYQRIALSLAHGHGSGRSTYATGPTALRPPAYPFFLAGIYWAFGFSHDTARVIEAFLGVGSVVLLGYLATKIGGRTSGLLAMAVAAIYLPLAVASVSLVTEAIFIPLTLGSLAASLAFVGHRQVRWLVLAGVLLGLASLTRSNGILLILPMLVIIGWRNRRAAMALVAALIVVLTPWTVRNEIVLHGFQPFSTETGLALAAGFNDKSLAHPGRFNYPGTTKTYARFFTARHDGIPIAPVNELQLDKELRGPALRFVADHPSIVPKTVYENARHFAMTTYDAEQPGYNWHARAMFFVLLAAVLLAAILRRIRRVPLWLWLTLLVQLFPLLDASGQVRFRAPIDLVLILLAGAAVAVPSADRQTPSTTEGSGAQ